MAHPNVLGPTGLYRIFGKSRETFTPTAENILAQFHPDDRPILEQRHRELSAGLMPPSRTLRIIRDDGQIVYVEDMTDLIYASDGKLIGRFGTLQDVTARVQAEALIAENRDNLARAEEMARLGHFKFELGATAITWSAGTYRIFGRSSDTFTPTLDNVAEFIHPDDRLAHERYRHAVLGGAELPPLMHRTIRDDGQIIYLEVWSKPLRASDGTLNGMFGTVQDITARKQDKDALAQANKKLTDIQYAIDQAIIVAVTDVQGNIIHANDAFCKISGYSRGELLGANHRIVSSGVHPKAFFRDMYRQIASGQVWRGEICNRTKSGSLYWLETTIIPQLGLDGKPVSYTAIRVDITARKQADEALERTNQELEARVAERTEALAQEMRRRAEVQSTLAQVQKMEAVGQLSAGVAHDFNNLLAVIGGGLEFIERAASRSLPADLELIEAALRATRRGRDLVQRLLTFSRQSPLSAEPTVIDQMVLDTLRLLQRSLGEDIEIVMRLDATGTLVSVDRNQLANALVNLALNARDAMPEGGRLTIATTCEATASKANGACHGGAVGEHVCIIIADTGVGMTDEVRARAFEPFFTTKRDGLSSGLGLSMVLGFVQQSGGHIRIDSEAGRGTAVTISLPRIEAAAQPHDIGDPAPLSTNGHDKTVLLVEDDPDVRVVVAAQLRDLGYNVHPAANAMEAIGVIESPASIAAVLTDIVLPGDVDGVTLLKEVMRTRPRVGVLCMSGYNPSRRHRKWLQVQNIELLEKPFSRSQLAQALETMLAQ
jgi:PAS domain S-box-containing protein